MWIVIAFFVPQYMYECNSNNIYWNNDAADNYHTI